MPDEIPILPRPLRPENFSPRPLAPERRARRYERNRPSQADVLLEAIRIEARKQQTATTEAALRSLVLRFNSQFGLDF